MVHRQYRQACAGILLDREDVDVVGVHAFGKDKVGCDAGTLAGREPLGPCATDDVDALVSRRAGLAAGAACPLGRSPAEWEPHDATRGGHVVIFTLGGPGRHATAEENRRGHG